MKFKLISILSITILLSSCKQDYYLTKIEGKQIAVSDTLEKDASYEDMIKPFRESVNKDLDNVISYAPETYTTLYLIKELAKI